MIKAAEVILSRTDNWFDAVYVYFVCIHKKSMLSARYDHCVVGIVYVSVSTILEKYINILSSWVFLLWSSMLITFGLIRTTLSALHAPQTVEGNDKKHKPNLASIDKLPEVYLNDVILMY